MQVGKTNYSGRSSERTKFFRLGMKDDQRDLTLRLAPPVKSMAERGNIAFYVKQHFGYSIKNSQGKDVFQTFLCIERRDRNKNVIEECPECEENKLRKAEVDAKEAALKAKGVPDADIELQLRPMKAYLKEHNLDRKWNMVAKNVNGDWGLLTIGHKCYEALMATIADLRTNKGIDDPLDPKQGVWFKFKRTGKYFNDIVDTVTVHTEQTAPGQFAIKFDQILEGDWARIEALPDLPTIGRRLTYEQVKMLVASGGEETVVRSVMESGRKTESSPEEVATRGKTATVTTVTTSNTTSGAGGNLVTSQVAAPVTAPAPDAVDNEIAALQAQMAALMKQKTAAAVTTKAETTTNVKQQLSPSIQTGLDKDVENFMETFGDDE
jgi:hypothetical protein